MSAFTLREAATKVREVAEAATPGPWHVDEDYRTVTSEPFRSARQAYDRAGSEDCWVIPESFDSGVNSPNLHHIALWHPAGALLVADWLDAIAAESWSKADYTKAGGTLGAALAVARAILGADS